MNTENPDSGWLVGKKVVVRNNDQRASSILQGWTKAKALDFFGHLFARKPKPRIQQINENAFIDWCDTSGRCLRR